jgi:2,5-diketo-D-gluconate reductase B
MEPLPPVGLGTMGVADPTVVADAIDAGYRHLDTAQVYENEAVVGRGIELSGIDREELFVATKLWVDDLGREAVPASTERSLDRLGLEYVDLLYVHRPRGSYDPDGTLPALDGLVERGLVRHVGLSNFTREKLRVAREQLSTSVFAHQVEFHPLFRPETHADAVADGHHLVAYSPLAGSRVFDIPAVSAVAERHGESEAAVAIAWLCSKERVVTIPKAADSGHLRANLAAADLELGAEDLARIDAIEAREELFPE